ncbi:hypothetical protein B0H66DRAFT_327912 [Apodospora peruviana]|uniref:BHLH domain-containing protein n=1 Tax=Apodospora peruviana TaxID=516989 RepID=A0AAE0M0U4_9PEZI|nr:hypothetical protein B0H66DRAFT_327912 [Apodospora peruviana]
MGSRNHQANPQPPPPPPPLESPQALFNSQLPFGYREEPTPPSLDVSNPLLNANDIGFFQTFFTNIDRPNPDPTNFLEGLEFTEGWQQLQPPTVVGHGTHLPTASPNDFPNYNFDVSGYSQVVPNIAPDVLDAAHVLSAPHNQQYGWSHGIQGPATMGPPTGGAPQQFSMFTTFINGQSQPTRSNPLPSNSYHDPFRPRLLGGSEANPGPPTIFEFGSDTSFTERNFVPRSTRDVDEEIRRQQQDILGCLVPNGSANNTRPPSPQQRNGAPDESISPVQLRTRQGFFPVQTTYGGHQEDDYADGTSPPANKRRMSNNNTSGSQGSMAVPRSLSFDNSNGTSGAPAAAAATKPPGGRRKSNGQGSTAAARVKTEGALPDEEPPSAGGSKKRRRNAGGGANKPPRQQRENLTEEEKRNNHIKSEQKRRQQIKEGYEELTELVPGLRNNGMSKSTVLTMTADHLESLLQGNRELEAI